MMASLRITACLLALLPAASGFHVPGVPIGRGGAAWATRSAPLSPVMVAAGNEEQGSDGGALSRKDALHRAARAVVGAGLGVASVGAIAPPQQAQARKAGVNRPDLLPKGDTNVIDLVGMLTKGQAKRINKQLEELEKASGYRLRLLCQKYPETPGLAIKDYWKV